MRPNFAVDKGKTGIISNPVFSSILCISGELSDFVTDSEDCRDSPTLITKMEREDEGRIECMSFFIIMFLIERIGLHHLKKEYEARDLTPNQYVYEKCHHLLFSNKVGANDGGYLVWPKFGKLTLFNGSLLHGVMPMEWSGSESSDATQRERTTIMLSFWRENESLQTSEGSTNEALSNKNRASRSDYWIPCAAMDLPNCDHEDWRKYLSPLAIDCSKIICSSSGSDIDHEEHPDIVHVPQVWCDVNDSGKNVTRLPAYEECFQGQ